MIRPPTGNNINHLRRHSANYWLWLSLLIIQSIGLLLVIIAIPLVPDYADNIISPALNFSQSSSNFISIFLMIFCIALAIGNGLVIHGIWCLRPWPLYFLAIKLLIDIFVILAVFLFEIGRGHLYYALPLFCSLCYMVVVYHHLTRKDPVAGT